jgi:hypothetical protein
MGDDILSGGAIDPSTSGPIPPSKDDRDRDILSEQKRRQDQDAIGGTQLPPNPLPPPEIQEIAPPLPPIDFNIAGLDLESTKEIARQTVVDVLKNVTINGQGPSVDGSSIAFSVSQEQSASESFGNIAQAARNAARQNGADIGFDDAQTARDAARQGGADISFNDAQAARDTARQKGADIDSDDAQAARDEAREGRSSARAYKAAEEERKERKESDPNFDRESHIRQKGETPTEFRERQEQLKQEGAERAQREEQLSRVRTGDFTEMPSGMIPVKFTRADGEKKIIAFMATEFVGVVEGAGSGEREATLPSEDSYYEAGGGECNGLGLYTKTVGTPPNTTTQVWVGAGTVAGKLPNGFDAADGKNIASSGSGDVWAEVNINQSTGEITSVAVNAGGNTPNSTNTTSYYTLGHYEYEGTAATVTNYGCGSIDAIICRNWFAISSPFYGLTLTRN